MTGGKKKKKEKNASKKDKTGLSGGRSEKFAGVIILAFGLFTIIFSGVLLYQKFTEPRLIAKILPAQNTIAVAEMITQNNHPQVQKLFTLLEGHAVYKPENLKALFLSITPLNFDTEIQPWLGKKIGVALYDVSALKEENTISPIIFMDTSDIEQTLATIAERSRALGKNALKETPYDKFTLYEFTLSYGNAFAFIDNYLVITENADTLKLFIDDIKARGDTLSNRDEYLKVSNNLPRGGIFTGYVNYGKLFDALEKDTLYVTKKGRDMLALRPFLNIFKSGGISVFVEKDRLSAQTFTYLDNQILDGETFITFSEKYPGKLLEYAGENSVFLSGGHDLTKEINRMEEIFKSGTGASPQIFQGLLEAAKQKYFGKEISLKDDIYPLLRHEYLLTAEHNLENPIISLLIELEEPGRDMVAIENIVKAFVNTGGVFTPEVVEIVLPDGTKGQEIVASPEKIKRNKYNFDGVEINSIIFGEAGLSLYYTVSGNIFILTTDEQNLKNLLDRVHGKGTGSLVKSEYYSKQIEPLLRTADELMHIKTGAVSQALGLTDLPNLGPYLTPFTNMTIVKNYFNDGISTIYLLEVL